MKRSRFKIKPALVVKLALVLVVLGFLLTSSVAFANSSVIQFENGTIYGASTIRSNGNAVNGQYVDTNNNSGGVSVKIPFDCSHMDIRYAKGWLGGNNDIYYYQNTSTTSTSGRGAAMNLADTSTFLGDWVTYATVSINFQGTKDKYFHMDYDDGEFYLDQVTFYNDPPSAPTITGVTGGGYYISGATYTVNASSTDRESDPLTYHYYVYNGSSLIDYGTTTSTSMNVTMPSVNVCNAYLRVDASDGINGAVTTTTSTITLGPAMVVPTGDGSVGNPYLISSIGNLVWVAQNNAKSAGFTGKYFKQTANIDISSITNWLPIGDPTVNNFKGTYDGNQLTVNGLNINTANYYQGLFGVNMGTIKNLGVTNVNVVSTGTDNGGLVGENTNSGVITGCYSTGSVKGDRWTGGLVGCIYSGSISNSYSTCGVSGNGSGDSFGGLVGSVGGGTISNSFATGSVSVGTLTYAGGLTGYLTSGYTVVNCFATGTVSGGSYTGGLIGDNVGTISYSYTSSSTLYGTNSGTVSNSSASKAVSFFKTQTNFTTVSNWSATYPWNFTTLWTMDGTTNGGYPYLKPHSANITSLNLSSVTLSPTFDKATTSYTATVGNTISSTTVTPVLEDTTSTVTVNGVLVASGQASGAININFGANTISVIVTAQGGTTKTYTITITRPKSTDSNLTSLATSSVTISPTFDKATTTYTATVGNTINSTTVTPVLEDATATVTVNGVSVVSGQASGSINLNFGTNIISAIVTAQDGTTKTYTVTITKLKSTDANLTSLAISGATLSPIFDKNTTTYSVNVGYAVKNMTVTPLVEDNTATIQVNGTSVTSGQASGAVSLKVGTTSIQTAVTAQDGTIKTYTITVTRSGAPVFLDATPMKGAVITANNIQIVVNTNTSGTVYWVCLPQGSTAPNKDQTVAGQNALGSHVTLSGSVNMVANIDSNYTINGLVSGASYDIYCIAEDSQGDIQDTPAKVTLATLSDNTDINSMTTSAGPLSPLFNSATTSYSMVVDNSVNSITVTSTLADNRASLNVNGTAAANGFASSAVTLNIGSTIVTVDCIAEDGTDKQYSITVTRSNKSVSSIALDKTNLSIYQYGTATLTPTITPGDATNTNVSWSSNNVSVATVDQSGVVTAVAPGTATITVTTYDGGKTATCAVTVSAPTFALTFDLTKDGDNLVVNIKGWQSDFKYQIWSYQKVTSDIILDDTSDVSADQWILSKSYTLGSNADLTNADGSIGYYISSFSSPDSNYTVSVRIVDASGNYVGELKDSYTPAEVHEVKITKVLVDGVYSSGQETKEIKTGASVGIEVDGNGVSGTTYTAKLMPGNIAIPSSNNGNQFLWDISGEQPGNYTVNLVATNGTTTDTRTISFNLYSVDSQINYGIISAMNVTGEKVGDFFNIIMNPTIINGDQFYYTIGEPMRTPNIKSGMLTPSTDFEQQMNSNSYGVFDVYAYIKRSDGTTYDDGIVKTVDNKRSDNVTMDFFSNGVNISNAKTIEGTKDTAINFNAVATIDTLSQSDIQYSYWRYDAKGWVLVKDWSSDSTLDWTPALVGQYTIQVRSKGTDAGSYEVTKSIDVNVTDTTDSIAQGVTISINQDELNANATARVPAIIEANATSTSDTDLLYKFYVSDAFLGTTLTQDYSSDPNCTWIPRKAGTYTIQVLVKDGVSFGKYDAMQSFTVTVK